MLPKFIGSVKDIDIRVNETKYFANVAIRPEEKRVVEIVKAQGSNEIYEPVSRSFQ